MRRVVITGIGILSCLGNTKEEVHESLLMGKSGIKHKSDYRSYGLRCEIAGQVEVDFSEFIPRKTLRFMGDAAAYTYIAMSQAIEDANLSSAEIINPMTGVILGSGGGSTQDVVEANDILRQKGVRRVGPYRVSRSMGSTVSACVATAFEIKGLNYSISSACTTSAHCIGTGFEQIQMGKQDIIFTGGGEAEHWSMSSLFDALGAFSTKYNETPEKASRPYDIDRDGFVIAGGGGVLVLEELEHARKRRAKIYAEVVGYGTSSDGYNMVLPSGDGAVRAMTMALEQAKVSVDYLNTHGTSTPEGDIIELKAVEQAFNGEIPPFSSTKSLTGHSLGATGVHEAIYSLLMLENGFLAASANIENLDPDVGDMPIILQTQENVMLNTVMSNNYGFGGTNTTLIFSKCNS